MQQFNRKYRIVIGHQAISIEDLDIEFEVIRTLSHEPNTAEISIYNLNKNTQSEIINSNFPPVSFFAGYKDKRGLIFLGDGRDCYSEHIGINNITHINCGDTERKFRTAYINKTFKAGTPVIKVMTEIIKYLGINSGNLKNYSSLTLLEGSSKYLGNVTFCSSASKAFTRVCKSCGVTYSIQNNILQLLKPKESLNESPTILLGDNLIGSPEIGSDNTTKFTTLLDSDIKPGRLISVKGKIFRAERVRYYGSSPPNQEWYTEVEGKQFK